MGWRTLMAAPQSTKLPEALPLVLTVGKVTPAPLPLPLLLLTEGVALRFGTLSQLPLMPPPTSRPTLGNRPARANCTLACWAC